MDMHELSLATEMIDLIRPNIPEGRKLKSVEITVGLLSGVCVSSLEFCFTELARQAGHPDATLKTVSLPAQYQCLSCSTSYETETVETVCPQCRSMSRTLLSGTEFSVDFIEV